MERLQDKQSDAVHSTAVVKSLLETRESRANAKLFWRDAGEGNYGLKVGGNRRSDKG